MVWEPILKDDSRESAYRDMLAFDDPRMMHLWDGVGTEAMVWSKKLGLPTGQLAWNVFIVLPRGALWGEEGPPDPAYWSHNLEVNVGIKYNPTALRQAVREALDKGHSKPSQAASKDRKPGDAGSRN